MGEDRDKVRSYNDITKFGLGIMASSISGVQQIRSQSIQKIKKELIILPTEEDEKREKNKKLIE